MLHLLILVALAGMVMADDQELYVRSLTMPESAFIEYFNAQNYTWKMAEYDNQEKFIPCAHIDKKSIEKLPVQIHDREALDDLPDAFDARDYWPQCETIKAIYNQDQCGSCWTFGTATTASDRTCIHKDIHVRLSEQDFECLQDDVCAGGNPSKAFDYWKNEGLVTQECKPYNIKELQQHICEKKCVDSKTNYKIDKHFAETVYRISNESHQIKAELVKNGPIQAAFAVFTDFRDYYKSGVYVHKFGTIAGAHSVRVIGYGMEDGVDYWLVANSWGTEWGENGFFKIKSYQEEIHFENYLIAGLPKN